MLHAAKTEGTIAFNGDDKFTYDHISADGIPHTDAHHAPRSRVESLPRFVHIDDVASKIERVCPFVYDVDTPISRECVPDCAKCARKVHWVGVGIEPCRHAFDVVLLAISNRFGPRRLDLNLSRLERAKKRGHSRSDVRANWCGGRQ